MIGVVFASEAEARPFLASADAAPVTRRPFPTFIAARPSLLVLVSGMGKVAAALAAQFLILRKPISVVVNAGICGALADAPEFAPGGLFRIQRTCEGGPGPGIPSAASVCSAGFWPGLPQATLVTLERPMFDSGRRAELAAYGQLVDMEGAVVARVATDYGIPCAIIKGVTDHAGDGDRRRLHAHIAHVSQQLAHVLWEGFREYAAGRFQNGACRSFRAESDR